MDFTYKGYEKMIDLLNRNKYEYCGYENYKESKRPVILRHDVDMSIEAAVKMAEFENRLDVKSTYFILISTDFYNLKSKKNTEKVRRIKSLGHEIGLHFDETQYDKEFDADSIKNNIFYEIELMEKVLNMQVDFVSMHRPSKELLESNILINNAINTYSKEFFTEFKYVSDSRMHWREDISEIISSNTFSKLHILTHPMWYSNSEKNMKEIFKGFLKDIKFEMFKSIEENHRNLEEVISKEEI